MELKNNIFNRPYIIGSHLLFSLLCCIFLHLPFNRKTFHDGNKQHDPSSPAQDNMTISKSLFVKLLTNALQSEEEGGSTNANRSMPSSGGSRHSHMHDNSSSKKGSSRSHAPSGRDGFQDRDPPVPNMPKPIPPPVMPPMLASISGSFPSSGNSGSGTNTSSYNTNDNSYKGNSNDNRGNDHRSSSSNFGGNPSTKGPPLGMANMHPMVGSWSIPPTSAQQPFNNTFSDMPLSVPIGPPGDNAAHMGPPPSFSAKPNIPFNQPPPSIPPPFIPMQGIGGPPLRDAPPPQRPPMWRNPNSGFF